MYLCCMGGWRRIICIADNLNHQLPGRLLVRWLCDLHDDHLTGRLQRDLDMEKLTP